MRRTEQLQGLRLMKFEEIYGRSHRGELSQAEAAEILGISERTFRRWRERFEAEGAAGLYDRRLGKVSAWGHAGDTSGVISAVFDVWAASNRVPSRAVKTAINHGVSIPPAKPWKRTASG